MKIRYRRFHSKANRIIVLVTFLLVYCTAPAFCILQLKIEELCLDDNEVVVKLEHGVHSAAVLSLNYPTFPTQTTTTTPKPQNEPQDDSSSEESQEESLKNSTAVNVRNTTSTPQKLTVTSKPSFQINCTLKLRAEDFSGIFLAVEEVHMERGKICKEYMEIIGKTYKGKSRSSKVCGDHRASRICASFSRDSIYEEQFSDDLTIKVSANLTSKTNRPKLQFVVTAYQTVQSGGHCNTSSGLYDCPLKVRSRGFVKPEYDEDSASFMWASTKLGFGGHALGSGSQVQGSGVCIWHGLTCDGHPNCPNNCADEQQCSAAGKPATNSVRDVLQDDKEVVDGSLMSKIFMGFLVLLVALLSVMSCKWACRHRNREPANTPEPSDVETSLQGIQSISTMVTNLSSVSQYTVGPPPSYAEIEFELGPPPDYGSVILFLTPKAENDTENSESTIQTNLQDTNEETEEISQEEAADCQETHENNQTENQVPNIDDTIHENSQ